MSVTAPEGFAAAGAAAGLRDGAALDMALVVTDDAVPVPCAAVFTSNRAAAAPVVVSRRHLAATGGRAVGVVLTAGNANAATGVAGLEAAEALCAALARGLAAEDASVLIGQTGLIGVPFPLDRALTGVDRLLPALETSVEAGRRAATAIMTTDTVAKEVTVDGSGFRVGGMAKGAAMLAPDMATMLAVLTTDAPCDPAPLRSLLRTAVDKTFNALSIDGCTSTNDTVVLLASGRGSGVSTAELGEAVEQACADLAAQMAGDAEGATKVARVAVHGAASADEARRAARRVADSLLVKCSLHGEDPYWGRVVSELGSAGVDMALDRVSVSYGGITVCRGGVGVEHDEEAVRTHMAGRRLALDCYLGLGPASATVLTTDLGHGYIDENRRTS